MNKQELKKATKKINLKKQSTFKLFKREDTIVNVETRKGQLYKIRVF